MPKQKKEELEDIVLDPIEEKVKEPAPVEEPVEPETVEEGEDINEPDEFIEPEFEEPVEGEPEDVEFDEDAEPEEETGDEGDTPAPFLGLMMSGAKNAPVSEDPDPQSRIEALLWHIINGTTTDAVPQSRNEAILTAIANSGTYTEEAQSRIEALLISILNHEESDITPISRNEAILKAIANNTEYNEEPQSRNEELLIEWLEAISIVIGTASGAVASFNTSLTEPLVKCECEFSASQASGTPTPANPISIDGVSAVQVTDCGKNILDKSTCEVGKNWNGNEMAYSISSDYLPIAKGSYVFSCSNMPDFSSLTVVKFDANKTYISSGNSTSFNISDDTTKYIKLSIRSDNTHTWTQTELDNASIQIELGSTATTYEAYQGTTAIVNLGGTYYGGKVDAVTGKITLTHKLVVIDENTAWYSTTSTDLRTNERVLEGRYNTAQGTTKIKGLCNIQPSDSSGWIDNSIVKATSSVATWLTIVDYKTNFGVSDFTAFQAYLQNNPIQIVYELATPIVVYASNTAEIPTIAGANNCFCDTGDVEVEYKKRRND